MQRLENAVREGACLLKLKADNLESVFQHAVTHLIEQKKLPAERRDEIVAALLNREQQMSTAIGHAVAVPHAYLDILTSPSIVFVQLARPINMGAPDGIPTRFFIVLLGPTGTAAEHLDTLTGIARLMSDEQFRYEAGVASDQQELLEAFKRYHVRTDRPPEEEPEKIPEGLRFTGRFGGGLVADIRRRLPHYASDFRDGLNSKSIASTLFLVFACLAPGITFGGIMAEKTGGAIGSVEMIVATAMCGILYSLISGQPLIILGGTGPLLIFTAILYTLCQELPGLGGEAAFLSAYAWVGLWTAGILVVLALADASALMRFFTRFTDETFAALISIIYIYEAVKALALMFQGLEKEHHATALLTLLLALGTFYIAMSLSRFRRSRYLFPWMREFLADFGPTIAIASMTLFAVWLHEVDLPELQTPETFGTTSGRPWLANLWAAPLWVRFAAVGPALLGVVLVFLDQNITGRIINSPQHNLVKGEAYHLDLAVVGGLIGLCSMFGLPWLVAATVRSLNHLRSLATFEEVVMPGGGKQERIIHVRETRVTALAIHLLIGLSLFLLSYLRYIPMAVLYGLFLFMGVVSIAGNQFFERLSLWLMDSKLYPTTHYIRRVPMSTIHKFTLLQLAGLVLLWIVKASPTWGILFPLFIALLVPVRMLATRWFSQRDLAILDAEEEPDEEDEGWAR